MVKGTTTRSPILRFASDTEFDYLAHVLMNEDVAAFHGRLVAVQRMEVGAADGAGGDLDDRVAWMLDLRIRNLV